jgi:hypothetical protein
VNDIPLKHITQTNVNHSIMIKILTSLLLLVVLTPSVEAGVSREPRRRPRCRSNGKVTVCRMPRHRKPKYCGIMPCIPPGYYRPNPPRVVPMR